MTKDYGKALFISEDEILSVKDRFWQTTGVVFNNIFSRVDSRFRSSEMKCRDMCFEEWGVSGVVLDDLSVECFNIFFMRFLEAFNNFPDQEWEAVVRNGGYQEGAWKTVSHEWSEMIRMLKLDKRFDEKFVGKYTLS